MQELKNSDRFTRVYSSLPLAEKKLTIVILDGYPFSWNVVYNEVEHNTKMGERMINKLIEMEII